jgi:hypothetical protein
MAGHPDTDKWRIVGRRLAMRLYAIKSASAAMGEDYPVS